jgi:two-component system, chemotaxis family, protein-glutamate methylesterase/glutaminase
MKRVRVLIVDDSAFYRQAIAGMLKSSPYVEVVGSVTDGSEAIKALPLLKPDVITLDLNMPNMDGFTFLRWLMVNKPMPVLVISSQSESTNVFRALEMGAVDFLAKTTEKASIDFVKLQDELVSKVETIAMVPPEKLRDLRKIVTQASQATEELKEHLESQRWREKSRYMVVVIGASTGGPPAIQTVLSRLPRDFPVPIAVVQHMPAGFTYYFADRLNHVLNVAVKEAESGDVLETGKVLICPGGHHMCFRKAGNKAVVDLQPRQEADRYVPSVDALMISAAEIFHSKVLGVLLTGMGNDGKLGMKRIKERGGSTIAESEETAVVFGMPKEAIQTGVVDKVLRLPEISAEVVHQCLGL